MTTKEAIDRLRDHFRVHDDGRLTPYLDEAKYMAISALEKQEKYKWHDLRKNPNDIPERFNNVLIALDTGEVGFGWRHKDSWYGIWDDLSEIVHIKSEYIIAWRYIETFEGGGTDEK